MNDNLSEIGSTIELSIIIPVFETPEKIVRESVLSTMSIKTNGLEVILADDGNNKHLACALDQISMEYDIVRVLHFPHRGVSAARNAAVVKAKGKYVTFLDADDILYSEAVTEVMELCRSRNPQLVISRISRKRGMDGCETAIEDSPELRRDLRVYYITLHDSRFREKNSWINRGISGKYVKRDLMRKCCFSEDLSFGEDVIWNFDLLNNAESLLLTNRVTYIYQEQSFGATQRVREHFPEEIKKLLRYYRLKMRRWPVPDRKYYYSAAIEYFTIMMRVYVFAGNSEGTWKRFQSAYADPFWRRVFHYSSLPLLSGRYLLVGFLGKIGNGIGLYLTGLLYDRTIRAFRKSRIS